MKYAFKNMVQNEAETIAKWHYDGVYSFYDFENDMEDLEEILDPEQRDDHHYYSVFEGKKLVGFLSFDFDEENLITTIGLELAPQFTGRGLGDTFLSEGLEFGLKVFSSAQKIQLAVAKFNKRAIKLYKKCGFKELDEFMMYTNGSLFPFIRMEREVNNYRPIK